MYRLSVSVAAVVVAMFATLSASQLRAQAVRTRIPVVTRLVQMYTDYERRLAEAINRGDAAEINQLIAKDFELRPANNIGVPTPRTDWIAQSLKEKPASIEIGQMAVHDYGNIRIVSFEMKRTIAGHDEPAVTLIDVWMKSGKNSVLKVRYAAIQTGHSQLVPGEVRRQQINKRY